MSDVRREIVDLRQETKTGFATMSGAIEKLTDAVLGIGGRVDTMAEGLDTNNVRLDALSEGLDANNARLDATNEQLASGLKVTNTRLDAVSDGLDAVVVHLDSLTEDVRALAKEQRQTNVELRAQQRKLTRVEERVTDLEHPTRKK